MKALANRSFSARTASLKPTTSLKECFPNDEFIVKASVGHIMKLALTGVGNMGIDFDNNYEPNFIIDPKNLGNLTRAFSLIERFTGNRTLSLFV